MIYENDEIPNKELVKEICCLFKDKHLKSTTEKYLKALEINIEAHSGPQAWSVLKYDIIMDI